MKTLENLLDETKTVLGVASDYALAKALAIPKARISDYYAGRRAPDEFVCLKISQALGKPLNEVIATVKAATEKDESRRKAWENYMKRLGGIAAAVVLSWGTDVTSKVTYASEMHNKSATSPIDITRNTNYAQLKPCLTAIIAFARHIRKMLFPRVYSPDWLNTCNTA